MRILLVVAIAILVPTAELVHAAQTAAARMYCLSLRFNRGTGPFGIYSLEFSGINDGINGELFPVFGGPRSHHSFLLLSDSSSSLPGELDLEVPDTDGTGDGFPDIFNVAQPFNGSSAGSYSFPGQNGTASATWSRSAGSRTGTCQLNLQALGTFSHTFTVLEYAGPLTYSRRSNSIAASVDLKSTGGADLPLKGPLHFTRSATTPYDQLARSPGMLTNHAGESLDFFNDLLDRDVSRGTNYYGYFEFVDWVTGTQEPDYYLWVISIDDLNDLDLDGIPDFSDDPARPPLLSLRPMNSALFLTISGDVGGFYEIQQSDALVSTNWPTLFSLTLTNDPQTVALPPLPMPVGFLRAYVP